MKQIILTVLCLTTGLLATVINVPEDELTIQGGINGAMYGDTVLVQPGIYTENIDFLGKDIVVGSLFLTTGDTSNISQTIIDGDANGSVVTFDSGETQDAVLCGFTIQNGSGSYIPAFGTIVGGGIIVMSSGATIEFNRIISNAVNHEAGYGGGIMVALPQYPVIIADNLISGNRVTGLNVVESGGGGIACYARTPGTLDIKSNVITHNTCQLSDEETHGTGGGIMLFNTTANVRNNIIAHNTSARGAGIALRSVPEQGTPCIVNNTISNNSASLLGGGLYVGWTRPRIMNSIIWGNTAPLESSVFGYPIVQYSSVEGGYEGIGNISSDPEFVDSVIFYLTAAASPCIDAGNPGDMYRDIEDPDIAGSPLFPAMGTLVNDMGAHGGNPDETIRAEYSPVFQAFIDAVDSVGPIERQTVVDAFIPTVNHFPFIEDSIHCYYIFQGDANSVVVVGDDGDWDSDRYPMENIGDTDFWFRYTNYEIDARLEYKFLLNGSQWILDPNNPNIYTDGFGSNSELAMPGYVYPEEIIEQPDIAHGSVADTMFYSEILENSRTLKIYLPPGYADSLDMHYPIVLFHDGLELITHGYALNTLDYLIEVQEIDPVIGIFVPPISREAEYVTALTDSFSAFIIDELLPYVDSSFRTLPDPQYRAMVGMSYGGLFTTDFCYNNSEVFGLAAPFSPSYWAEDQSVMWEILDGPQKDVRFYIDWGTYEATIAYWASYFAGNLADRGYDIQTNEWHEGHSNGSWRAHLDEALITFFPFGSVSVADELTSLPTQFKLRQNYPNPFNPSTTLRYELPIPSDVVITVYDIVGRHMTNLSETHQPAGSYSIKWNGMDDSGNPVSTGVYLAKLEAGDFQKTIKMVYLR